MLVYDQNKGKFCRKKSWYVDSGLVLSNENDILLPKLLWPTERKNCSRDRDKLLKFETEGREFAKFLRSLEQFIQTVKGQNDVL